MKKVVKRIGIGIGVAVASVAVILLGFAAFHRIALAVERDRIEPIGHMVEVNGEMMHVYITGENDEAPLLVFLPGGTIFAPVYHFKPLYSLLTDYRIAVVEPFGFGYSDITSVPRYGDVVVSEMRQALHQIGEIGPFILIPHSAGGQDALRWAQLYPDEVAGIVGINMMHPAVPLNGHLRGSVAPFQVVATWIGLQRLPMFDAFYPYPYHPEALTEQDQEQLGLLIRRNAMNGAVRSRVSLYYRNAQIIVDDGLPNLPVMLIVTTHPTALPFHVAYQEEFGRQVSAQIAYIDTGHFAHQYEPQQVADIIRTFINDMQE